MIRHVIRSGDRLPAVVYVYEDYNAAVPASEPTAVTFHLDKPGFAEDGTAEVDEWTAARHALKYSWADGETVLDAGDDVAVFAGAFELTVDGKKQAAPEERDIVVVVHRYPAP